MITVNDCYHLDKNYRGSHHLVSGPESDDPEVVEKQILGARETCGWILKIVATEGILFVPGAKSRERYQLPWNLVSLAFQRFSIGVLNVFTYLEIFIHLALQCFFIDIFSMSFPRNLHSNLNRKNFQE
jgi:hypothetical protein